MTHSYPEKYSGLRGRRWALAALLVLGTTGLHAQSLNYKSTGVQNSVGTYTDLGTSGTAIATDNTDDANSTAQDMGFSFSYNGQTFTQFVLNTNGYLKLGNVAPSAALYFDGGYTTAAGPFNSTAATDTNLLIPFNQDLQGTATTEYRVLLSGTAPNRVCTIQWKDVRDKATTVTSNSANATGEQFATLNFQVKLYETTNTIEFVYGTATAGSGADIAKFGAVGLKGNSAANNQLVTLTKPSAGAWTAATSQDVNYTVGGNGFNFRKTAPPAIGSTFRFRPTANNDAGVVTIYTLGKLPLTGATPHVIRGVVRNTGLNTLTNVPVTLQVSGANTFTSTQTVASLPAGATTVVSFAAFTPTTTGNNTISVSLPDDDVNENNTSTTTQQVTNGVYSYATPGVGPTTSYGGGTTPLAFLSRFTATDNRTVQAVNVYIGNTTAVGKVVYGVVVNTLGAIIARSPDYTVAAADIGTYKTFTLSSPTLVSASDFFVGLALTASTTSYFPVGTQAQDPTRRMASYTLTLGDGSAPRDNSTGAVGKFMIEAVTSAATCLPPANLAIVANSVTATGATLSFTAPAGTAPAGYSIVYGPTGFDPATAGTTVAGTASPVALTGLMPATAYQAYVRSTCGTTGQSILSGPVAFTTLCTAPAPLAAFPYNVNFDGVTAPALPCGFTVFDANADGFTWATSTAAARSAPNALTYNFNNQSLTTAADDWVFTPALTFQAAQQYLLSFYYRVGNAATPERLEIKVGTAPTVAGMTTTIYTNNSLTATTFTQATAQPIRVTTDGTYYVGMHVTSAANSFRLSVDDVTLTAGPLAVNQALSQAVAAYPNPTTGLLNVDLRSSKARQAQATVINALGQTVLTRTLSTKQPDQLDLAPLAAGIYTLKLNLDGETAVKRISLQK